MKDILAHRLPSRMRELEAFVKFAVAFEASQNIVITASKQKFSISDNRVLLHPLADAASLMGRALLHFLGIGSSQGNLISVRWQKDDLSIRDLNLPAVSPHDAISKWDIDEHRAADLLLLSLTTANKVSAHLTKQNAVAVGATISDLIEAFSLINALVNREVYAALHLPRVDFEHEIERA